MEKGGVKSGSRLCNLLNIPGFQMNLSTFPIILATRALLFPLISVLVYLIQFNLTNPPNFLGAVKYVVLYKLVGFRELRRNMRGFKK